MDKKKTFNDIRCLYLTLQKYSDIIGVQEKGVIKMNDNKNYFNELMSIDVNDKTEKKGNLTYLSWAFAWGEIKKRYPSANYVVYERMGEYGEVNYFTDGMTAWVKTGVIINNIEHIEYLPVLDFKNKSIPLENVTSFNVNTAIQRSLTKAIARHGLGLYIYAGEDLPFDPEEEDKKKALDYINKTMQDLIQSVGEGSRDVAIAWLELEEKEFMVMYKNKTIELAKLIKTRLEEEKI